MSNRKGLLKFIAIAGLGSAGIFAATYFALHTDTSTGTHRVEQEEKHADKHEKKNSDKSDKSDDEKSGNLATAAHSRSGDLADNESEGEVDEGFQGASPSRAVRAAPHSSGMKNSGKTSQRNSMKQKVSRSEEVQSCVSLEYGGGGPNSSPPSLGEWQAFMKVFHSAKRKLVSFLEGQSELMEGSLGKWAIDRVQNLKAQRPPTVEEPELAYRGIIVLSQGPATTGGEVEPLIRMGGGFLRTVEAEPKRAEFEVIRVLAQSISPCELEKAAKVTEKGTLSAWFVAENSPLSCLKQDISKGACRADGFAELAWAYSTTLAWVNQSPGCKIPAFEDPKISSCLSAQRVVGAKEDDYAINR